MPLKKIILLLALLGTFLGCNKDNINFEGSYTTISESEWQIKLVVKENGVGEYIHESWMAGQSSNKEIEKKDFQWWIEDKLLVVNLEGVVLKFQFERNLVFDQGPPSKSGPGLSLITGNEKERLLFGMLWREPISF